MMTITATAFTAPGATELTVGATKAFLNVLKARQLAAKIPVKDRIQVRVVKSAEAPKLLDPRSKALPILVLFGGLIATVAVAFTRDNVSRRERPAKLTTAAVVEDRDEADTTIRVTDARSAPRSIPHADTGKARDATGPTIVNRGRATLGSVSRRDSATGREPDSPDEVARQGRRG
jgi:hypothetical protein